MTCHCEFSNFLKAFKDALCMPEFPSPAAGAAFSSDVNTGTSKPASCASDPGFTGGVKGSWAELISATPFAAGEVLIEIGANSGDSYMVDIGIGGSGSEVVLIANLAAHVRGTQDRAATYRFRLPVPAGSRISARAADSVGINATVYVKITFLTPSALNGQFSGSVETYGATPAAFPGNRGVNVDPGATANTKSGWVEITSATLRAHQALAVSIQVGDNVLATNISWLVDIGIGGSGSEVVLIPNLYLGASSTTDVAIGGTETFDLAIPAGSRLSARAQCSSNTDSDRDIYVSLYGN